MVVSEYEGIADPAKFDDAVHGMLQPSAPSSWGIVCKWMSEQLTYREVIM